MSKKVTQNLPNLVVLILLFLITDSYIQSLQPITVKLNAVQSPSSISEGEKFLCNDNVDVAKKIEVEFFDGIMMLENTDGGYTETSANGKKRFESTTNVLYSAETYIDLYGGFILTTLAQVCYEEQKIGLVLFPSINGVDLTTVEIYDPKEGSVQLSLSESDNSIDCSYPTSRLIVYTTNPSGRVTSFDEGLPSTDFPVIENPKWILFNWETNSGQKMTDKIAVCPNGYTK